MKSNTTTTSNIKPSPKVCNSNSNSYRKNPLRTDICTILHNDDLKTEEEEIFVAEIVNIDDDDGDEDLESGSTADDKNNVSGVSGSLSAVDSAVPTTALRPTSNSIPSSPLIRPVSTSLLTSLLLRPATAGPSTPVMFTPPQSFAVFKDRQVEQQTSAPASPASTPAVHVRAKDGKKRPAGAITPGPVIIIPRQQIMELGNSWQKKRVPIALAQDQKKLSDASPGKQRSNAKVGEVITGAFSLISYR